MWWDAASRDPLAITLSIWATWHLRTELRLAFQPSATSSFVSMDTKHPIRELESLPKDIGEEIEKEGM